MDSELMICKCGDCQNHSRADCLNNKCECCDLEDMFALLSRVEPVGLIIVKKSQTVPNLAALTKLASVA